MIIKRKLYSFPINYVVDEKLFFNPAIRLKRVSQKYIGKVRRGIAEKLKYSARKNREDSRFLNVIMENAKPNHNSSIEKRLIREARKNNSRVIGTIGSSSKGENLAIPITDIKSEIINKAIKNSSNKAEANYYRKILNTVNNGKTKYIIQHPSGTGTDLLAHEIGHTANSNSKNPVVRWISKSQQIPRENHIKIQRSVLLKNKVGGIKNNELEGDALIVYKNPIKAFINNKLIKAEETNASNTGFKLLKKLGMPKEQLTEAAGTYKAGLSTYKNSGKAEVKESLANIIQIPSRKRTNLI